VAARHGRERTAARRPSLSPVSEGADIALALRCGREAQWRFNEKAGVTFLVVTRIVDDRPNVPRAAGKEL
jgi:hypothetical protein